MSRVGESTKKHTILPFLILIMSVCIYGGREYMGGAFFIIYGCDTTHLFNHTALFFSSRPPFLFFSSHAAFLSFLYNISSFSVFFVVVENDFINI